nr:MAG TPA: hypothetical protein [Caudoviricetes sp.]
MPLIKACFIVENYYSYSSALGLSIGQNSRKRGRIFLY